MREVVAPLGEASALGDEARDICEVFRALAAANRIELLRKLATPKTVSEVELEPVRERSDLSDDRTLSRQAVKHHVTQLVDAGLVEEVPLERSGQHVTGYVTDPSAVSELIGRLSTLLLEDAPSGEQAVEPGAREARVVK